MPATARDLHNHHTSATALHALHARHARTPRTHEWTVANYAACGNIPMISGYHPGVVSLGVMAPLPVLGAGGSARADSALARSGTATSCIGAA